MLRYYRSHIGHRALDSMTHLWATQLPLLVAGVALAETQAAQMRVAFTIFGPVQTFAAALSLYAAPRVADRFGRYRNWRSG